MVNLGDVTVGPVAARALELMADAFTDAEHPPVAGIPCRLDYTAGLNTALETCCAGNACSGQVWVRVARFYRTDPFPSEVSTAHTCATTTAVVLELGAARCAPFSDWNDETAAPTSAQLGETARQVLDDAARLRWVACGLISDDDLTEAGIVGSWEPFGPEGGCVGGTLLVTIERL